MRSLIYLGLFANLGKNGIFSLISKPQFLMNKSSRAIHSFFEVLPNAKRSKIVSEPVRMLSASSKDGEHLQPILSPQVETQSCVEWEPYSRLPISWQTALFNETKLQSMKIVAEMNTVVSNHFEKKNIYINNNHICPLHITRLY